MPWRTPGRGSASVMRGIFSRSLPIHGVDVAVAGVVAVQILPLLLLQHVGSVDGPAHLLGATVLAANGDQQIYREYYYLDRFPYPNLATHYLLAALVRAFEPATAEKLLVATYLILFGYGLRRACLSMGSDSRWAVPLGLAFATNSLLMFGFYNFCLGLVVLLLGVAYIQTHKGRWTKRSTTALGVLFLVAYLTHLVPMAILTIYLAVSTWLEFTRSRYFQVGRLQQAVLPSLAVVPVTCLTAVFLTRPSTHPVQIDYAQLPRYIANLVTLRLPLVIYTNIELIPVLALLLGLSVISMWAITERRGRLNSGESAPLLVTLLICLALYVLVPEGLGQGGMLHARLSFFPPLFLVLILATTSPPPRLRSLGIAVGCLSALTVVLVRLPLQERLDKDIGAYVELTPHIQPGSLLVGLRLKDAEPAASRFRGGQDPLLHVPSLVAARTRSVDGGHYEAATTYFPVRFRPERDPYTALGGFLGIEEIPPRARISAEPALRYVFVWYGTAPQRLPGDDQLLDQLGSDFLPKAMTASGSLVLYERKR